MVVLVGQAVQITGDIFGEDVGVLLRDFGVFEGAGLAVSEVVVVVAC